jgi:ADP-L-glycero-D-manno-heptose 6-epimerase
MYSQQLWEFSTYNHIPFVYASSAATYGDGSCGYDDNEDHLEGLEPLNPYGQSKHDFDKWAIDGAKYGFCPPMWMGFKFFNVYGFGESHKGRMSSMVLQVYDQIKGRNS